MPHHTTFISAASAGAALGQSAEYATSPSLSEFEETLKRLVDRIARILQSEKCVFILYDTVAETLYATEPALGFTKEQLLILERPAQGNGFSSEVFRTNTPHILSDTSHDPRAEADGLVALGIQNAVSVPLIVEKRDDDNRLLERTTVGVLHVFNKKYGHQFDDEDVRLLQRMAIQGAAVIAQAQMYREVVQEKQELIHTIDSLYAGLLMVGNSGRLVQINPSARAILGLSPQAPLIGQTIEEVVSNDHIRHLLQRALRGETQEVADEISVPVLRKSNSDEVNTRIYQIQCAPVRDDANAPAGIVAIFNDITDIRGIERIKTAFIATVSHELRTPLTSIKGFVSTLLADKDNFYDETTRHEFYKIIDMECDRLTRLITDLLDISRIEQGQTMQMHWECVDISELTKKVMNIQRAYATTHVLSCDFSPDIPCITADADKLDQILTNLISNAIKYSPHGGHVSVNGRLLGDARLPQGRQTALSLQIVDEGMGIAREHLPKLFERFYRVDNRDSREIGGTGIGLALVKALVDAHHGEVKVESELGQGTTFTLLLPVHQKEN